MRPQYEHLQSSQMQKCTCDFLHSALPLEGAYDPTHELYQARDFLEWSLIERDYSGKKYAKDKQMARCGNAVPPPFAEALVRVNLPEMCVSKVHAA
ncbi:hypothetical protein Ent638_2257 [Enterobacter sp. 638]|uniref:DNA (cytosine-5-)-methyltransferase n=1 Tax=Enterobacter sp. (strain 638) TaxID=399742 RepID=A0A9J9KYR7_ENT38|nr:hypothetical protein Ent638_2257 [Enterobacter sp. 638]